MKEGDEIVLENSSGALRIRATSPLERVFEWKGSERKIELLRRTKPWNEHLTLYFPGTGDHWKMHDGVTRAVVEEGRVSFGSKSDALAWLARFSYLDVVGNEDGLFAGWAIITERNQLDFVLWRVTVSGMPFVATEEFRAGSLKGKVSGQ
ncbi:MAG: hypothetical protein KF696_01350 [Planctomycetes bacterium]|nr:hypothetical protein [Planctomycetota bacterium]MCW8134414.1 hypothetical protein [Planctomycetota bacterium]